MFPEKPEEMNWGFYLILLFLSFAFWLIILLPTYPFFLLMVWIAHRLGADDVGYWEFTKEWFTFQVIP